MLEANINVRASICASKESGTQALEIIYPRYLNDPHKMSLLYYFKNMYNEHTQEYDWPDGFFQVSNGELNLYSSLDKRAVETLRTALQQRSILDYRPGIKNKRNPAYKMNLLH